MLRMSDLLRLKDLLGRRSASLLGLDVGSSAVKAVELEPVRTGYRVVAAGCGPVPHGAIRDGAVADAGAVAGAIRSVIESHRIRARAVAASLAGSAVVVRKISVPPMSGRDLDESIYWEADQHVPFDAGDVALDYQVLEPADEARHGALDVLLVAARRERVAGRVRLLRRAGLTPAVIDVDALALQNAYEMSYGVDPDAVVLIHAGAGTVTTAVVRAGRLEFSRDAALCADGPSDAPARDLHTVAEGTVVQSGEMGRDTGEPGVPGGPVADLVAREVERAMADCGLEDAAAEPPGRVVASGGRACSPRFIDALADRLGVPITRFDPWRNVDVAPRVRGSELLEGGAAAAAVALGLACRRSDER